ncbi:hypothetical protein BKA19_4265 [Blastococcus saxobsidens]|uniref:Uncharacterized protein n=1 Tax=Blastococcus saxobsidens TaxID=138336 RepID=A0A4Q7YDZ0_9ACTN|nr:hypothetical protein BKA19_4265 [Blastococcus saxobsidens]
MGRGRIARCTPEVAAGVQDAGMQDAGVHTGQDEDCGTSCTHDQHPDVILVVADDHRQATAAAAVPRCRLSYRCAPGRRGARGSRWLRPVPRR